jgi:hypothetical protein
MRDRSSHVELDRFADQQSAGFTAGSFILPLRYGRLLVGVYFGLLLSALLAVGLKYLRAGTAWGFADWLINYQGGFVRRGLLGEIALRLNHLTGTSSVLLVMMLGFSLYATLFYCVWKLLEESSWRPWVIAAVVSPATLAFPVLVPRSGYHKEILYLTGLGVLLLLVRRGGNPALVSIFLAVVSAVTILSHEPVAAYGPYLLAALLIAYRPQTALKCSVLPGLVAVLAMAAVLTHPGDRAIADRICSSLSDPSLCTGAIGYLGVSKASARADVIEAVHQYHYYRNYSILGLLAAAPLLAGLIAMWRTERRSLLVVLGCSLVAILLSTQLFLYGTDWGRWIYIHILSLFLLLLFIDSRREAPESEAPRFVVPWYVLPYMLCWSMPGYTDKGLFGYLDLVMRALHRT